MAHKVTVYIGRFNPFHQGHAYILEHALRTSSLVIVLVGSTGQARSLKNPFTFDERRTMIEKWRIVANSLSVNAAVLRILPIRDYPYNDALWIRQVQRIVKREVQNNFSFTDEVSIHVTGSDRDESTWYLKAFPQWKLELLAPYSITEYERVSATRVREWLFGSSHLSMKSDIAKLVPDSTLSFLKSFALEESCSALRMEFDFIKRYKDAWKHAPYPPTFTTVDSVVVQSGHVLLVKRGAEPGEGLWALPGGFVNQSEKLRDAAIRELVEETGIRLAEGKKAKEITTEILKGCIRESDTFDKPDRDLRGRTITTAFLIRLDDTKPLPKVKGQDDAAEAFWVPINDALERTDKWYADHHAILETLIAYKDL